MAKANWFARGAIIGAILGGLLAGVPWLGLIGTDKGGTETAILAVPLYGALGSVAGLLVGSIAGLVITAIIHLSTSDTAIGKEESGTSSQETPSA